MSLKQRRHDRDVAEAALQGALGECRSSTGNAMAPLRRWWPALVVGVGALAGWRLAAPRSHAERPARGHRSKPSTFLAQAMGLLPLVMKWNTLLSSAGPRHRQPQGTPRSGATGDAAHTTHP